MHAFELVIAWLNFMLAHDCLFMCKVGMCIVLELIVAEMMDRMVRKCECVMWHAWFVCTV